MNELKIGLKKFLVSDEIVNQKYQSSVALYKNKQYELFQFSSIAEYNQFVDRLVSLKKHNIEIPKIYKKAKKNLVVVRALIKQDNCASLLFNNRISDAIFEKLFLMYRMCRAYKFDLDYKPENYVYDGRKLYYIGFDMIKKNEQFALETYGLYFWLYSKEGIEHLKEMGYDIKKITALDKASTNKNIVLLTIKYW